MVAAHMKSDGGGTPVALDGTRLFADAASQDTYWYYSELWKLNYYMPSTLMQSQATVRTVLDADMSSYSGTAEGTAVWATATSKLAVKLSHFVEAPSYVVDCDDGAAVEHTEGADDGGEVDTSLTPPVLGDKQWQGLLHSHLQVSTAHLRTHDPRDDVQHVQRHYGASQ
jgi:hypothetical protein